MLEKCGFVPHPAGNVAETHYLTGEPLTQYDHILRNPRANGGQNTTQGSFGLKTIVFDMYGVIARDPGGNLLPFVRRSFPHLSEEDVYVHWRALAADEISTDHFWRALGYEGPHEDTQRAYLDSIEIDPGFFAAARVLKQNYRLALLSNDIAPWSRYLRDKHGLDAWFDAVVVSGEVGVKKPDPNIYRLLLGLLGQEPGDCLFIDDRERFLAAAQALGMRVALFNSRKVPWDGDVVNNFEELLALISPP